MLCLTLVATIPQDTGDNNILDLVSVAKLEGCGSTCDRRACHPPITHGSPLRQGTSQPCPGSIEQRFQWLSVSVVAA